MKRRPFLVVLLFLYLAVLLRMTVFREEFGSYPLFSHGDFNLNLFSDLIRIYHNSLSTFIYLFVGNIVTFIPFGFLVLPLFRRKRPVDALLLTVVSGFLLSLCIELSQWAFGVGVSELDDLILNTFGVFLGAVTCLPFRKSLQK